MPGDGVHLMTRVYSPLECGRLGAAAELAAHDVRHDAAQRAAGRVDVAGPARGRCALLPGQPGDARRWFAEARVRSEENNHAGPRRIILSALVTLRPSWATLPGRPPPSTLAQIPPLAFQRPEQERRGGPFVVEGDLPRARRVLRAVGRSRGIGGYRTSEAASLHDVARLGEPAAVVERLAVLAAECEGEFVRRVRRGRSAAVRHQADALADVAERSPARHALLLAAEAATEAAQAYQRAVTAVPRPPSGSLRGARRDVRRSPYPCVAVPVTVVPLTRPRARHRHAGRTRRVQ